MISKDFDILIIGTGIVGCMTALCIHELTSYSVGLIGPKAGDHSFKPLDQRTSALMQPSITLLKRLGLWDELKNETAPLKQLRMVDCTDNLIQAPQCLFSASDLEIEAFAYNLSNKQLMSLLETKLEQAQTIDWCHQGFVEKIELTDERCTLYLDDGRSLSSSALIGADGRQSRTRSAANIATKTGRYPQTALVCNFSHSLPHNHISTELHYPSGPMTFVPLPENQSSLVWSLPPHEADIWLKKDGESFAQELMEKSLLHLGAITHIGTRASFPISYLYATQFHQNQVAVVGEAAHTLPPIGAQGLNLGLLDAATIAQELAQLPPKQTFSNAFFAYHNKRFRDVKQRQAIIHTLNQSLLSDYSMPKLARMIGLSSLKSLPMFRQSFMKRGMNALTKDLPTMMREA